MRPDDTDPGAIETELDRKDLGAGADRRVVGVYALLQALLPLSLFALALALPSWLFRHRRALRTGA